jgi:hypothetical protein
MQEVVAVHPRPGLRRTWRLSGKCSLTARKSTRQAARESGLSRYTIRKVLRKNWISAHETPLRAGADTRRLRPQNGIWGVDAGLTLGFPSTV